MPQQLNTAVENNFTKGLITEATGLNFPENAATDTDNCTYTLIGDVTRRLGINLEPNASLDGPDEVNEAITTYKWNNASGDGLTQLVCRQIGNKMYFFKSSDASVDAPLSNQLLAAPIFFGAAFTAQGGTFDLTAECQYADGNGYLFVFHPSCDPFYCTFVAGVVTGYAISVQIRDFTGILETTGNSVRPGILEADHAYNLQNQGWTQGAAWSATSVTAVNPIVGSHLWGIGTGVAVTVGDSVAVYCTDPSSFGLIPSGTAALNGIVTGYSGGGLTVNCTSAYGGSFSLGTYTGWTITQQNQGHIDTWFSAVGNYPSNSDVWWYFKDNTGVFAPATTINNTVLSNAPAPKGHYIYPAFNQNRALVSGIDNRTPITTTVRPRTGAWFAGRVFYAGADAFNPANGDAPAYAWTENIYYSQIVQTTNDFGLCYQTNDPTSEEFFDLLPTDGGVVQIQGCGSVYKLFAIQNGLIVFAANGIWFITGSQGIGFAANDFTITKLSAVKCISGTSFVNVNGLPYFWNAEGIYAVQPQQQGGGLSVEPLTVGTILTFYDSIPLSNKKLARGDYDPINYVIQWIYKSTEATSVSDRYAYDRILNFNTYNKAFFPYSVAITPTAINSIVYVDSPGGLNTPDPTFKYAVSVQLGGTYGSFAEEYDEQYIDWNEANYTSYFVTGYKIRGQGIRKFQPQYIQIYSKQNGAASAYKIQGIWDYADDPNSGRWSSIQLITNALSRFGTIFRRHKIRGHGYALQFKLQSVDGQPFDIQGWAVVDTVNTGT